MSTPRSDAKSTSLDLSGVELILFNDRWYDGGALGARHWRLGKDEMVLTRRGERDFMPARQRAGRRT